MHCLKTTIIGITTGLLFFAAMDGAAHACTSFCLDTPNGPVFATNLDSFFPGDGHIFVNRRGIAKENTRKSMNGEPFKWAAKYGSVTFNLAGREYVWSGMNERGLALCGLELRASQLPEPDERPPFDNGLWAQYILDTCGSVQEAIQAARRTRLVCDGDTAPTHFLIADAAGECAAIEYHDGRLVVYGGEKLPVKAMTNMPYARTVEAYLRGGPRWWWSNPGRSAERFADAAQKMRTYDADQNPDAMTYALETLAHVVSMPNTRWSVVYDLTKREIRFGSVVNPPAKTFSLTAFDLSCEAPLLMLDINAAPQGNVERAFVPFDYEANLRTFRTLCERYKIDISAEETIRLMRHFEGFKCAH